MDELNGVRRGQRVRDLDGTDLGKVTHLYDWGFRAEKGFPILFGKSAVIRYSELRGIRNGELVVARSARDLFDLALGEVPPAWRIPAPPEFPSAATPSEARLLFEDLAAGAISTAEAGAETVGSSADELTLEEERRAVETRGQAHLPPPPQIH
jgi:hypothetical protein